MEAQSPQTHASLSHDVNLKDASIFPLLSLSPGADRLFSVARSFHSACTTPLDSQTTTFHQTNGPNSLKQWM
jgi:hypothetical protein